MAKRTQARVNPPRLLVSWEQGDEGPVPVDMEEVKPIRNRAERRAFVRELSRRGRGRDTTGKGAVPRMR